MRSREQVEELASVKRDIYYHHKRKKLVIIHHHFCRWGVKNLKEFLSECFHISTKWETRFSAENEWEGIRVGHLRR